MKRHIVSLFATLAILLPVSTVVAAVGTGSNVFTIPAGSDYGGTATNDISSNNSFDLPLGYGAGGTKDLKYLIALTVDLINRIVPLIFSMAVIVILWGIAQSISGSDEKRSEGKQIIIWGVVGLFAMVSIWGLVNILVGTLQLDNNRITIPRV